MRISGLTIFPDCFPAVLGEGMIRAAREKGRLEVAMVGLREFTDDSHRTTDDYPFGGGAGMIMKVEPIDRALLGLGVGEKQARPEGSRVVLLSPQGRAFTQEMAIEYAGLEHLVLVCGRYKGGDGAGRRGRHRDAAATKGRPPGRAPQGPQGAAARRGGRAPEADRAEGAVGPQQAPTKAGRAAEAVQSPEDIRLTRGVEFTQSCCWPEPRIGRGVSRRMTLHRKASRFVQVLLLAAPFVALAGCSTQIVLPVAPKPDQPPVAATPSAALSRLAWSWKHRALEPCRDLFACD